MIKNFDQFLNEDSLDDFDIGGKIAKERAGVSEQRKREVRKLIGSTMTKIQKNCKSFFEKKGLDINKVYMLDQMHI